MQYWGCVLNIDSANETEAEFLALQPTIDAELREIAEKCQYQVERGDNNQRLHYQINLKSYKKTQQPILVARYLGEHLCHWTIMPMPCVRTMDQGGYSIKEHSRVAGPWCWPMTRKMANAQAEQIAVDELPPLFDRQLDCRDRILLFRSDRAYMHLYDLVGGWGKQVLAEYFELKLGAVFVSAANAIDMAYVLLGMISPERQVMRNLMIIIDVPKAFLAKDVPQLCLLIEELKNKRIKSTKYKPETIRLVSSPTVVVTTNYPPSLFGKYMTAGRIEAIDLREDYPVPRL